VGLSHIHDYIKSILFSRDHDEFAPSISDSEKYYLSALDLPSPSGILIYGLPGSGKSTLASEIGRLCRNKYRCLTLACTDLVHKIVGESEQALVQAFALAREMSPCLLVLDNIDIILGSPAPEHEHEEVKDGDDDDDESSIDSELGNDGSMNKKHSWQHRHLQ
jgi:SpoVK/Ycf46/Vps4 family AAA+-type ATPase